MVKKKSGAQHWRTRKKKKLDALIKPQRKQQEHLSRIDRPFILLPPLNTAMATITPEAAELTALISSIKQKDPGMGVKKVLAEIQAQQPTWLVSEKRVKKMMGEAGIAMARPEAEMDLDPSVPVSHIDTDVDVSTLTNGQVKARMINKVIGKGINTSVQAPAS
jgi:hypothetical protein